MLTVAERLLLTEDYDDVSVRSICAAAQVNPAAVHYHFGSKDDLAIALLQERLGPLWADDLDAVESGGATVAQIVDIVVAPFLAVQDDPVGRLHLRLLSRFVLNHPDAPWTGTWYRLDRWTPLLTAVVDGLDADTARRRWALAFTLVLTRFGAGHPLSERAVAALRDFVVAGLSAPAGSGAP
nr:TetR/AcrR family transcriptional regulator [Gordonia soli]